MNKYFSLFLLLTVVSGVEAGDKLLSGMFTVVSSVAGTVVSAVATAGINMAVGASSPENMETGARIVGAVSALGSEENTLQFSPAELAIRGLSFDAIAEIDKRGASPEIAAFVAVRRILEACEAPLSQNKLEVLKVGEIVAKLPLSLLSLLATEEAKNNKSQFFSNAFDTVVRTLAADQLMGKPLPPLTPRSARALKETRVQVTF